MVLQGFICLITTADIDNVMKALQFLTLGMLAINIFYTASILREVYYPNQIMAEIQKLQEHTMIRDTETLKTILEIHHELKIHKMGEDSMCPKCFEIIQQMQLVSE